MSRRIAQPPANVPPLLVARIQRFCLQDGPGIRTTIFTQGCSLACWWCHNADLRGRVHRAARAWDARPLADHVQRDARYWRASGGGVTISGGEPMIQPEALAALLAELGRRGHDRCIETAGAVPLDHFQRAVRHVDRWLYDIKALSPERFRAAAGGDAAVPVANLRWLLDHTRTPVTVRVPLINGFNAGTDEPQRIAALLAGMPRPVGVEVLPGHNVGCDLRPGDPDPRPAPRDVERAAKALAVAGLEVSVRW